MNLKRPSRIDDAVFAMAVMIGFTYSAALFVKPPADPSVVSGRAIAPAPARVAATEPKRAPAPGQASSATNFRRTFVPSS